MKTELKREVFYTPEAVTDFVNKNKITKENIQTITVNSRITVSSRLIVAPYVLFYWEVTQ